MSARETLRNHVRRAARGSREAHAYYMRRGGWALGGRRGRAIEKRWDRRGDRRWLARRATAGRRWDDPEGPARWP